MSISADLRHQLNQSLCRVIQDRECDSAVTVALPWNWRDGDGLVAQLKGQGADWRISDKATTLMRLSFENELPVMLSGARGQLIDQALRESGVSEDDGELFLVSDADGVVVALFQLALAMIRVESLGLWTRQRVASVFDDDRFDRADVNPALSTSTFA